MASFKLAMIQMNSKVADRDANVDKALRYIDEAVGRGPDLVVVPEFFNTEYFSQYRDYKYVDYAEPEDGYTVTAARKKAAEHGIHLCATIYELERPGFLYDTAFMIDPRGEIIGKYRKVHPAAVQSLEKIYFRGGTRFPTWDINGLRVGAIICYDHFFPEAARCAAANGAELIIGPFAAPEQIVWDELMVVRAWENGVYLAPCNKVGQEGEWVFGGASMVVDPFGQVLHRASTTEDELFVVDIDRQRIYDARRRYPMLRDRRPEAYGPLASTDEVNQQLQT